MSYTWHHQHSVMLFFITQARSQHISMLFKASPVQEAELIIMCQTTRWVEVVGSKIAVKTSSRAKAGAENENKVPRVLTNPAGKLPRWVKYTWLASTPLPWDHCGDHCGRFRGDHYFMEIIVKIGICILSSRSSICQTTRWVEVIGSKIAVETSSRAKIRRWFWKPSAWRTDQSRWEKCQDQWQG